MGHDHPYKSGQTGNGLRFTVRIDLDEPNELKYNAVPWPFRTLADRQMEDRDIRPGL